MWLDNIANGYLLIQRIKNAKNTTYKRTVNYKQYIQRESEIHLQVIDVKASK